MISVKYLLTNLLMLAQETPAAQLEEGGPGAAPPNPLMQMAPMLIMFVVLFYFIVMRPQQREQRKRQDVLSALKKNDKVLTIGGIIGTIVDFSSDGQRITLKVDDGTRIKFTRSSIQGPYDEKAETESADKKS